METRFIPSSGPRAGYSMYRSFTNTKDVFRIMKDLKLSKSKKTREM